MIELTIGTVRRVGYRYYFKVCDLIFNSPFWLCHNSKGILKHLEMSQPYRLKIYLSDEYVKTYSKAVIQHNFRDFLNVKNRGGIYLICYKALEKLFPTTFKRFMESKRQKIKVYLKMEIEMLVANYPYKKDLKNQIGKQLNYTETSMFGPEYKPNGSFCVVGPRATERKWYAKVTMENGLIKKVS
jgi:hypothetical protein